MTATTSILLCSVQRCGSWLVAHAMEDTGVLGRPAEYFHRGDEPIWSERWGTATEDEYLTALLREATSPNGVWSSKMMWNYFDDAMARLRRWSGRDELEAALPGLTFVWLRRRDTLRQAISWWRADVTGQYALAGGDEPAEAPTFDRKAIASLKALAEKSERGSRSSSPTKTSPTISSAQ